MGTNERGEDSTIDDAAIAAALSIDERDVASIDAQIERDAALARSLSDAQELVLDVDGELDRAIARAVAEAETGLVDVIGERSALKNAFVPKLNDFVVDASTTGPPASAVVDADHSRLLLRLDFYGVREKIITGDGNCQFRALSDQLFRDEGENHDAVRAAVCDRLVRNPDDYAPYAAPLDFDEYVQKMSNAGEWGDHITLQAAADAYGVDINIITSYSEHGFIEITPKEGADVNSPRSLWLSFFAEVHYNSIVPGPRA